MSVFADACVCVCESLCMFVAFDTWQSGYRHILSEVLDEITVLRVGVNVVLMTVIRLNQ